MASNHPDAPACSDSLHNATTKIAAGGAPSGLAPLGRPACAGETAPPRPRLAFRLGVVGHRPNRLRKADLEQINDVLKDLLGRVKAAVKAAWDGDLYLEKDGRQVVLRAISPLAEGADRLFARQALDLGYSLCCVMPFTQEEYEKDFAPGNALVADSVNCFEGLLDEARQGPGLVKYEMDGTRSDAAGAYGAAGRVVLNQSDLLVVIWDGQRQEKRGGTEEIFDEALGLGVPVIWIDAQAPHAWQIVDAEHPLPKGESGVRATPDSRNNLNAIERAVTSLLGFPQPTAAAPGGSATDRPKNEAREHLKAFLAERKPAYSFAVLWGIFQTLIGSNRCPAVQFKVPGFEGAVESEWPRPRDPPTPIDQVADSLRPFYAWPDKLAVLYANRYRSTFLLAFLLTAAAVGMALLPVGAQLAPRHGAEHACIFLELAAISTVLIMVGQGRRQRWHERWLDYRMVAELVRHLRLVAPLGGKRRLPPIPAHWTTYGQPAATWMAWYVRAVERDLGLPAAVVGKDYLLACLDELGRVLTGQVSFHAGNRKRNERLESRLHRCGVVLLGITLLACALHLGAGVPLALLAALTFCCGFFPAIGAALGGIANQGEFLRIHKRSRAMQDQLTILLREIDNIRSDLQDASAPLSQQYSPLVSTRASDAARLLVHEVLDWRVVFLDRPLTAPT